MDNWQSLQAFWGSFGIPAYDESSVPENEEMPYITYEAEKSEFDVNNALTASIWYYSQSWADISVKADEIWESIGYGGVVINKLWIKRGTPFAQRMSDPDSLVRRIVLNVEIEFFES